MSRIFHNNRPGFEKMRFFLTIVGLFLALGITSHAQAGVGTVTVGGGGGGAATAIGTGLLAARGLSSPAARMAAQRRAYQASLPADHHAVVKHGAAANRAYNETADTSKATVKEYHCADGRDRTVNWATNAMRVEQGGEPVTAFHYSNRTDLHRALLRDGCIEEIPTRAIGHDNVRQIPGPRLQYNAAPVTTGGPRKTGTPTAMELAMARRAAGVLK